MVQGIFKEHADQFVAAVACFLGDRVHAVDQLLPKADRECPISILTLRLFGPNDQLVMVSHERTSQITTFYSKSPGISYARISVIAVVTDMVSIRYLFEVVDMR